MKQENSGVKGNTNTHSMDRNLSRDLKRKEPAARMGEGDICAPIVESQPFSRGCEKRRDNEKSGGPQVGMGKAKISSDSRTQDLISDKNPKLNHHGDRIDEHGGIIKDGEFKTDMTKSKQGNTLAQPSDGKNTGFNRKNQVANSDDSI